MTKDDFIRLQNIVYMDWQHKNMNWQLHKSLKISIQSWVCAHMDDVFYFPEVNGIQIPFNIGI
jgi:hypothetical protein